jgi:hypothetical protein
MKGQGACEPRELAVAGRLAVVCATTKCEEVVIVAQNVLSLA